MAWLSDWAKRRKITIDSAKIDSDLTHFPVPVFLGTSVGQSSQDVSDIFDEVGSNWQKIAVTDSTGDTQVYVEVEKWDATNEAAVLWVSRSDLTLTSSSDSELYIYFDNSKSDNTSYVADPGNRPEVWDSSLRQVLHYSESSGSAIDSTSNSNDGTVSGATQGISCPIDGGYEFDGTDDVLEASLSNGLSSPLALSILVKYLSQGNAGHSGLFGLGVYKSSGVGVWEGSGNLEYWIDGNWWSLTNFTGDWEKIDVVIDSNGNLTIYRDNSSLETDTASISSETNVEVGGRPSSADAYSNIQVCESRIYSQALSAAWRSLDLSAWNDNVLTFSATEENPVVSSNEPTNVTGDSATLNGTLESLEGNSSLDVYFEYGTSTSYGNTTATQTISSVPTSFNADISGLTAFTTYHCRAVATDGTNYWYGDDVSFFTYDLRDVDETQSEFQEGTLTDVVATLDDNLELAQQTVEEDGNVTEFEEPVPPSSHSAVTSPVVVGNYSREVQTTGTSSTYDEILYDNESEYAPSNLIFHVYLPNLNSGSWVLKKHLNDDGDNIITGIGFDGFTTGGIAYYDGDWNTLKSSYAENTWIKVEFVFDWTNYLYDIYLDDTLEQGDISFNSNASGFRYWKEFWDHSASSTGLTGYVDHEVWPGKTVTDGNRLSPQLDLSSLGTVDDTLIEWTETLNSQTITIETRVSLDGGSTWTNWATAANGGTIPDLEQGTDISNGILECRQTLSTDDATTTPELHSLSIYIAEAKNFALVFPAVLTSSKFTLSEIGGSFAANYEISMPRIKTASRFTISSNINFGYPHIVNRVQPDELDEVMGIAIGKIAEILNT